MYDSDLFVFSSVFILFVGWVGSTLNNLYARCMSECLIMCRSLYICNSVILHVLIFYQISHIFYVVFTCLFVQDLQLKVLNQSLEELPNALDVVNLFTWRKRCLGPDR